MTSQIKSVLPPIISSLCIHHFTIFISEISRLLVLSKIYTQLYMNPQRIPPAFIFLVLASLLASVQSICLNNGNYTTNSTYSANLNTTLSSLSTKIDINGFYNVSAGQIPDRANAVALCRGDVQLDTCRECIQDAAAGLLQSCPNQKQAIDWHEFCMVRYSNETIFGKMEFEPGLWLWNQNNATSPDQFEEDLRTLMDNLRSLAENGGSLRKVAAGNVTAPAFQRIFALVQCTPDLSPDDCSSCLIRAVADIPSCCDRKRGGRVLRPSCSLRFEVSPFYNETRLQELALAPPPATVPAVPVPVAGPPPMQSPPGNRDSNRTRTVIIVVVSIAAFMTLAVSICILLRKRMKHKPNEKHEVGEDHVDYISTPESLQYDFSTIKTATNDFSDNNKLGQGGFGVVYKGKLPNGQKIAVKRLSKDSGQGDLEFKNEVLLLAKLQHRNLVRLLGFSLEGIEKLLIYEFVQNASLDLFIFDPIKRTYLDWDRRYKIIVSIARGILYLHEDSRVRIIHRDLKASNILLDREMNPKIADFGMARLFEQDQTQGNTTRIAGTYGYMAPEYAIHGQFSTKSDVFSFGVLVLEIINGQKNNCFRRGENVVDLLSYAWKNWHNGTSENLVDPFLRSSSGSMRDIVRCIHISLLCVQENAVDRPIMASVVLMLSSFSLTLGIPSEPAFYLPDTDDSEVSQLHKYNSRESDRNNSSNISNQAESDHSSRNDASISELYPR